MRFLNMSAGNSLSSHQQCKYQCFANNSPPRRQKNARAVTRPGFSVSISSKRVQYSHYFFAGKPSVCQQQFLQPLFISFFRDDSPRIHLLNHIQHPSHLQTVFFCSTTQPPISCQQCVTSLKCIQQHTPIGHRQVALEQIGNKGNSACLKCLYSQPAIFASLAHKGSLLGFLQFSNNKIGCMHRHTKLKQLVEQTYRPQVDEDVCIAYNDCHSLCQNKLSQHFFHLYVQQLGSFRC